MGDFRKKILCRLISREKNYCQEIPGEKNTTLKKYLSRRIKLENILHRCMTGKRFYHQRFGRKKFLPAPQPLQMVGP